MPHLSKYFDYDYDSAGGFWLPFLHPIVGEDISVLLKAFWLGQSLQLVCQEMFDHLASSSPLAHGHERREALAGFRQGAEKWRKIIASIHLVKL